ncbi:cytochrome c oxidase subunit 3 [Alkalimonas collagenimarina]|uniref:Cytochrome c oxidase subunit 3 n=1 Tax=Alkalimonas collagenimarina TaxID=400390 RepID=A0ABT9GWP8_9GAMM|nr:cytochrome c oxidase subunit 3 [Alkalimonas collagenimarina]MDP4535488.1 cytochrome c oxidase subunit 3 [Alkalimonas collagenimarina]
MSIFTKLMEKPWLAQPEGADPALLQPPPSYWPARTALRFLLVTITVVFSLFIMTLLGRSQLGDFHALAGEPWLPFDNPTQLWWNTGILLASSVVMHAALVLLRQQKQQAAALAVVGSAFLVLLFLLAQFAIWQQLETAGFGMTSNPASSYFYLLTAVHGVHLLGGLVALLWVLKRFWQQQSLARIQSSVRLCVTYWHYLFVVWLVLFALMTSSSSTIDSLAALCGF